MGRKERPARSPPTAAWRLEGRSTSQQRGIGDSTLPCSAIGLALGWPVHQPADPPSHDTPAPSRGAVPGSRRSHLRGMRMTAQGAPDVMIKTCTLSMQVALFPVPETVLRLPVLDRGMQRSGWAIGKTVVGHFHSPLPELRDATLDLLARPYRKRARGPTGTLASRHYAASACGRLARR